MVKYPLKFTSDILTSYSFTISTLIRLIKKIVPVTSLVSYCTENKYYMLLLELFCDSSIVILLIAHFNA